MTIALSYNPGNTYNIRLVWLYFPKGGNAPPILKLQQAKSNAYHPILLPAFIYSIFCDRLRGQIKDVRLATRDVRDKTDLGDYLKLTNIARRGDMEEADDPQRAAAKTNDIEHRGKKLHTDYDVLHKHLVEQQARMTNSLADFLSDLNPACHSALSVISNESSRSDGGNDSGSDKNDNDASIDDKELQTYIQDLNSVAKIELQYRDQLLSQVNMQLKVIRRHEIRECAKAIIHAWYKQKQPDLEKGIVKKTSISGKN